jgi:ATP-binding cassette, subfamily B (MDR/TAP), member 1
MSFFGRSHDELMAKPKGKYKKLIEAQGREASTVLHGLDAKSKKKKKKKGIDNEEEDEAADLEKEAELTAFSLSRARKMAAPDSFFILAGAIGALVAGSVFPMWGLLFAGRCCFLSHICHFVSSCKLNLTKYILETIELLFRPVSLCDDSTPPPPEYDTCQEYWNSTKESMQDRSFEIAVFWAVVAFGCIFGNMVTFWGFGNASERLSKRVRDSAFSALVRQEVAFFDKRSVGKITSELQDDAARIQTFTGEPIRSFLIAMASVVTGLVLSFVVSANMLYLWRKSCSCATSQYIWTFSYLTSSSCGLLPFLLLQLFQ